MPQKNNVWRGKQSREEQTRRREAIAAYIKENGPVKSGELCEAFELSRSSLSDDINAINAQGDLILSPKRGWYEYNPSAGERRVRRVIDRAAVRRWIILSLLAGGHLSYARLKEELDEQGIPCGDSSLHADLTELKKAGYISLFNDHGHTYYRSSAILGLTEDDVNRFNRARKKRDAETRIMADIYDDIGQKLRRIEPEERQTGKSGSAIRSSGRRTFLSRRQVTVLAAFEQFPYQTRRLVIPYKTAAGLDRMVLFETGLIVYSVETGQLYLLGKDEEETNIVIPLERVILKEVKEDPDETRLNRQYESKEFLLMFRQMLNLSMEEPVRVRVRFLNKTFIREKVERLHKIREFSLLETTEDGKELIYTDTIRGLDDFARYLRRFGRAAIAEEPAELKERLIHTSEWVCALYDSDEPLTYETS